MKISMKIKSHVPNTTGVDLSEMLTYKPLTNNAVKKNTCEVKKNSYV
jgi:hypothetical protein